ncbi:efflux pump antibiotic resistance protein [Diplocarpon mali]|nr:efflux pump antibiotic resistance protein [Diplocarpon mali]
MEADERTQLLAKPATDRALYSQQWDAEGAEPLRSSRPFGLWQTGALFGIMLAYANTSLVWATHETVASRFDSLKNSSWMMTSFTIGYCVTLPLYGRLSDKYGRLNPLIAAYGIFCIGCGFCGVGQTYWQVILGRVITGSGASGIISLASIVITDIAAPSDVAVLRSYVNVASTVGLASGGPLGGLLGGTIGWRWPFLGQVPIAAVCCLLTARGLRKFLPLLDQEDEQHIIDGPKPDFPEFDYPGAITLAIGLTSFLAVIDLQNQLSWTHPVILNAEAGGHIAPSSFGNAIGNLIAGQIIKKLGNYKILSLISLFLCMATSLLILIQWSHPIGTWAGLEVFPFGLFAGVVLSTQFIGLYNRASKQEMATAISMYYMSQQIGIALGISLTSSLLNQQFQSMLQNFLADIPNHSEIIRRILADSSVVETLPAEVQSLVSQSFLKSFWLVPAFALAAQVIAILPMVFTAEKMSE